MSYLFVLAMGLTFRMYVTLVLPVFYFLRGRLSRYWIVYRFWSKTPLSCFVLTAVVRFALLDASLGV